VHVAVEPEPVPVAAGGERSEHAAVDLVPDPGPHARDVRVELVAEQVIDPGQLGGDLAGTEVQERVGRGGHDRAVHPPGVVVRGPAPAALLTEQGRPVGDLVDPAGVQGDRRDDRGPAEPLLAGEDDLLITGAVAVAEVPGVGVGQGHRPRRAELRLGAPP
jgi:hypothetical protein